MDNKSSCMRGIRNRVVGHSCLLNLFQYRLVSVAVLTLVTLLGVVEVGWLWTEYCLVHCWTASLQSLDYCVCDRLVGRYHLVSAVRKPLLLAINKEASLGFVCGMCGSELCHILKVAFL